MFTAEDERNALAAVLRDDCTEEQQETALRMIHAAKRSQFSARMVKETIEGMLDFQQVIEHDSPKERILINYVASTRKDILRFLQIILDESPPSKVGDGALQDTQPHEDEPLSAELLVERFLVDATTNYNGGSQDENVFDQHSWHLDSSRWTKASLLYSAYKAWSDENGQGTISQMKFGRFAGTMLDKAEKNHANVYRVQLKDRYQETP